MSAYNPSQLTNRYDFDDNYDDQNNDIKRNDFRDSWLFDIWPLKQRYNYVC